MGIESLPPLCLRHHAESDEHTSLRWRVSWYGVTLLAVGLTMVTQYPVAWAAKRIAAATGHCVLPADNQGTIWHDNVALALVAGNGDADATVLPDCLSWSIDMLPLLAGTLRTHLVHERALEKPVTLAMTPGYWDVEVDTIALPVSLLEGISAPSNTLKLDDRPRVQWMSLSGQFGRGKGQPSTVQGALIVTLEQVSSSLSRVRLLGSYQAVVPFGDVSGAPTQLSLSTLAGPLSLQDQGILGPSAHSDEVAGATPESEPQLIGLLSLPGPRDGSQHRLRS